LAVRRFLFNIGHADLDVDDRFGGQTRHCGGSDVVDSGRHGAERVPDAAAVFLEGGRPGRTVRLDDDGPLLRTADQLHFTHRTSVAYPAVGVVSSAP
jgi:hypothetical protein